MSWSSRRYGAEAPTVAPQSHRSGGAVPMTRDWPVVAGLASAVGSLVPSGLCRASSGGGSEQRYSSGSSRHSSRTALRPPSRQRASGIGQPRAAVVGEVLNGLCAPGRQPAGAWTRGPGTAPRTRRVLACRIALLAAMTGDVNPVHVGAKPAGRSTFGWDCGLFDAFCCPASAPSRQRVPAAERRPPTSGRRSSWSTTSHLILLRNPSPWRSVPTADPGGDRRGPGRPPSVYAEGAVECLAERSKTP